MNELSVIVQRLQERRDSIDQAIQILQVELSGGGGGVPSLFSRKAAPARRGRPARSGWKMSAAARRRISLAAKARWAALKAGKKKS